MLKYKALYKKMTDDLKDLLKDNLNDWYENLERKLKKM